MYKRQTVVPKGLKGKAANDEAVELWGLWNRRQSTKFNGVSYIIQRGAEAVYSEAGQAEVKALVSFYMENAAIIRRELSAAGLTVYGGEHAPYVWIKTPEGMDSWGFFDHLLNKANVVGTPGSGFGAAGERLRTRSGALSRTAAPPGFWPGESTAMTIDPNPLKSKGNGERERLTAP